MQSPWRAVPRSTSLLLWLLAAMTLLEAKDVPMGLIKAALAWRIRTTLFLDRILL